jgi:hypothetical protein
MTKTEKVFKTIEAAVAKDPDLNVSKFCKAKGLSANMYYRHKRTLEAKGQAKLPVVKYQRLKARKREPLPATEKMIFVMGSAEQIRDVMGAL